jgi:prevent-host-death family protein
MKSLNVTEFRVQCLTLLEQLPAGGVLVTKRGKPIARVVPVREDSAELIGSLAGAFQIRGDIVSTGEAWNAQS